MVRYHIIPHSHWDREWYLSFDEFRGMLVNMIDDLIDILDRDTEYRSFLLDGQTSVLEDYLEVRPERRQKLVSMIQNRRLFVGPWYVLPDSFLVSGEALIRNLLRGTRTAQEFGSDRFAGYIPDSFGHTGQLPQIFRGFGIDTAIFWRGFGGEPGQEGSEYRWESPDGSWVLAEHLHEHGYSGAYFDSDDPEDVVQTFEGIRALVDARTNADARLMLSGGDHHWPVARLPRVIEIISEELRDGASVLISNPVDYFDELKSSIDADSLTQIQGEQRFGYRWAYNVTGGVYSSRMPLKQANAQCQRLLEGYLERLDAVSAMLGLGGQSPLIQEAWRTLLQNHPHDSICGCSIDPVHREMDVRFEKVEGTARAAERFLWQALVEDGEGVHADDRRIVVFNPSPFQRSDVVECDVEFHIQEVVVGLNPDVIPEPPREAPGSVRIKDSTGRTIPSEVVGQSRGFGISLNRYGYPAQSLVERFRLRFRPDSLKAVSFESFHIDPVFGEPDGGAIAETDLVSSNHGIENAHLKVTADRSGAFWVELKDSGERFGPIGLLEDSGDAGDEYNYSPPTVDQVVTSGQEAGMSIGIVDGLLEQRLVVESKLRIPLKLTDDLSGRSAEHVEIPFETAAILRSGSPFVSFETKLDNRAKDHRLRLLFDTGCRSSKHFADAAFGLVEREARDYDDDSYKIEVPARVASAQRFVVMQDTDRGVAILNDGLPEYEVKGDSGVVALTLLRCVGQLSRGGLKTRPGGRAGWYNETPDAQCPGQHVFRSAFVPFTGSVKDNVGAIERAATSFMEPIRTRRVKKTEFNLPEDSFVELDGDGLVLSALKKAEDGKGIVVRVYNATGDPKRGSVVLRGGPLNAAVARLDEVAIHQLELDESNRISDSWKPGEIKTYRLEF